MRISEKTALAVSVAASLAVGCTTFLPAEIYSSAGWFVFWAVVAAGIVWSVVKTRLWHRPAVFMLHLSFILILAGGGVTALTAERGTVHLKPGEPVSSFVNTDGSRCEFPVTLSLDSFRMEYYPGMTMPRDFHTYLDAGKLGKQHISMNNIGRLGGWRLYQQSFDDEGGTILSVSRDPAGIALTYCGYALFAVAGLLCLFGGSRRFRISGRKAAVAILLPLALLPAKSWGMSAPAVPETLSDSLACCQVIFRGRVIPFEVMADELTRKFTGRGTVGSLSPERFVASLMVYPERWRTVPFLKVKNQSLLDAMHVSGDYVSPAALYDASGKYLPQQLYADGNSGMDKDILRLDEKVALLAELWQGELFRPLERGEAGELSEAQVRSSLLYTRLQPVRISFILLLSLGLVSFAVTAGGRKFPVAPAAAVMFFWGLGCFVWKWTISGYMPLSTVGEIMQFTSTAFAGVAWWISRRSRPAASGGLLMAGFVALVAWLSLKEPVMTPLMPVLASGWLPVHVSLVMTAYAFLGMTLPLAIMSLVWPRRTNDMMGLSLKLIAPGVYLLGLGIFTGAMWANVSWGRYWAWDPKETWALVTMLLYAIPLHRTTGLRQSPRMMAAYLCLAFLSIIMTYAGVNLLPSKHAYI